MKLYDMLDVTRYDNKVLIMAETKVCKKCKRELPADLIHFNKLGSTWDGLHLYCKECRGHKFRVPYNYGVNTETERKCSVCDTVYPKTGEYFSYNNKAHTKFSCVCKKCAAKKSNNPKRKEYYKQYIKTHAEINRKRAIKREALLHQNLYTLTPEQYEETLRYFNNACAYCGSDESLTRDHVIPITKGGATSKENIVPACVNCNSSKSNSDFSKWFKSQYFYNEQREQKIIDFIRGD